MNTIGSDQFTALIAATSVKPRFKRDLRYMASIEQIESNWDEHEILPIWNKSKQGGILLLQPEDTLYLVPFAINKTAQNQSGRTKPIICDLCFTWQSSGNGKYITFYPDPKSDNTIAFLCCGDLRCSDHVRSKTAASAKSRAQLPEHLTNEDRTARLRQKTKALIKHLNLEPQGA